MAGPHLRKEQAKAESGECVFVRCVAFPGGQSRHWCVHLWWNESLI